MLILAISKPLLCKYRRATTTTTTTTTHLHLVNRLLSHTTRNDNNNNSKPCRNWHYANWKQHSIQPHNTHLPLEQTRSKLPLSKEPSVCAQNRTQTSSRWKQQLKAGDSPHLPERGRASSRFASLVPIEWWTRWAIYTFLLQSISERRANSSYYF